jgi:hypothetical protein
MQIAGVKLPMMLICGGRTNRSLPKEGFRSPAEEEPYNWVFTATESHWQTSVSVKMYIRKVVVPHYEKVILFKVADGSTVVCLDAY